MTKKKPYGEHGTANTVHIGDAIQNLLKTYHIKSRFDEASLVTSWERLVGKPVAKRTKRVFVRDHVLFVELDSPGMKHDLSLHKKDIVAVFAKEFGPDLIRELVIM
jgi:predicted nucleic acid-binding Zn ribbon protein